MVDPVGRTAVRPYEKVRERSGTILNPRRPLMCIVDMSSPAIPESSRWSDRRRRVRARLGKFAPFVAGAAGALLILALYTAVKPGSDVLSLNTVEESVALAMASATAPPAISAQVYQIILPSLVIIQTKADTGADGDEEKSGFGVGSGVIVNNEAAILTALHNVADATEIRVTFADGTQSFATIATEQPENDIAVLAPDVPPEIFVPATLGSAGRMRIGDEVFAVGNPLGLSGSMSAGVISGFDRNFAPTGSERALEGLIQFDAAVNPGNSGGPLVNRYGHVVGIVTGLINPTKQQVFIGIGFAVPIGVAASGAGGPAQ